jgi:4a-hydroxytetrahydrobiopterin dehydratase
MKYLIRFNENLNENSDWVETPEGLYKKFEFSDFRGAIDFINSCAEIIDKENHHPKITNLYNKVEILLSTHDAGNSITEKDYDLAKKIDSGRAGVVELTNKEKKVLVLLKQGKSYKEIADELGISFYTVNFHIKNLYKKFGVNSNIALMAKKLIY